jgi:hypothetical protein
MPILRDRVTRDSCKAGIGDADLKSASGKLLHIIGSIDFGEI